MTISQIVNYLDILQDKYGSPYFTDAEKERLLIQAELDIISDYLPKDGGEDNIELNANTWMVFNPLVYVQSATMSATGAISKATVEAAISSSLGYTAKIIRPLSITWTDANGDLHPVKGPTRYNNWATYLRNVFKRPTEDHPRYYETSTSYMVYPINTGINLTVNVLRYPKAISISGSQTSELSDIIHNELVARALELAGIGSRDQMLIELQKLTNSK